MAIIELAVLIGGSVQMSAKSMTKNETYLDQAQVLSRQFKDQSEPERLREASMALSNIVLAQEHDPGTRIQLRAKTLLLWLHLLEVLDDSLDPNFDPSAVPEKLVQPPESPDGEILRPGASPDRIADPIARAEYEKAIEANRAKQRKYRIQLQLHRLDGQLGSQAESFVLSAYSSTPSDQKELSAAINEVIKHPARKARLLKLLRPTNTP